MSTMNGSDLGGKYTSLGGEGDTFVGELDIVLQEGNLSWDGNNNLTGPPGDPGGGGGVRLEAIVSLSIVFCIIGVVGIVGNLLVILIVLTDRKMRRSVTNLFIMNLAVSDLLIMAFGVPEIVMFMINQGWLMGEALCKLQRYVLVFSLYSSVITLVAVCIERYIAIVHPIKAHIFCSRRRMLIVITLMWPGVLLLGLPVVLYNRLHLAGPPGGAVIYYCVLRFSPNPGVHIKWFVLFRYVEFVAFYLVPMVLQVACYITIGHHLFAGSDTLHRKQVVVSQDGVQRERTSDAIKARKGVIKMLIASVIIYFVSYSPHQVLLFYNTFSHAPFHQTWVFLVFVTAMGYVNSAANPVLYCIFSQNFRRKFRRIFLGPCSGRDRDKPSSHFHMTSTDSAVTMSFRKRSTKTILINERVSYYGSWKATKKNDTTFL